MPGLQSTLTVRLALSERDALYARLSIGSKLRLRVGALVPRRHNGRGEVDEKPFSLALSEREVGVLLNLGYFPGYPRRPRLFHGKDSLSRVWRVLLSHPIKTVPPASTPAVPDGALSPDPLPRRPPSRLRPLTAMTLSPSTLAWIDAQVAETKGVESRGTVIDALLEEKLRRDDMRMRMGQGPIRPLRFGVRGGAASQKREGAR